MQSLSLSPSFKAYAVKKDSFDIYTYHVMYIPQNVEGTGSVKCKYIAQGN